MRRKRRNSGIYRRGQRFWGDFRAYRDVGGKLEPLIADGERLATMYPEVASILYGDRVKHYETLRRNRAITGIAEQAELEKYARYHLRTLQNRARANPQQRPGLRTIERYACALANVIEYMGANAMLSEITPARLTQYIEQRQGDGVSPATIRQELVALSRLMKRAVSENRAHLNPVAQLVDRPTIARPEAVWLEREEAAALLDAMGQLDAALSSPSSLRFARSLTATFLLTGGRRSEVLGLEVSDVDFRNNVVWFRENQWRAIYPIKRKAERAVLLWPQLREILGEYVSSAPRHISGLLFPSPKDGKPLRDFRGTLARACRLAKIHKHVTPHTLRHTYAAARLRTYHVGQHGESVRISLFDIARELGHQSPNMIEKVYGHVLADTDLYREVRFDRHVEHAAGAAQ